ncbi:MAG: hypothetical protein EZS28_044265, partial [Streblomastix strix]
HISPQNSSIPDYRQRRRVPRRSKRSVAIFNPSTDQLHRSYTLGKLYEKRNKSSNSVSPTIPDRISQLRKENYNREGNLNINDEDNNNNISPTEQNFDSIRIPQRSQTVQFLLEPQHIPSLGQSPFLQLLVVPPANIAHGSNTILNQKNKSNEKIEKIKAEAKDNFAVKINSVFLPDELQIQKCGMEENDTIITRNKINQFEKDEKMLNLQANKDQKTQKQEIKQQTNELTHQDIIGIEIDSQIEQEEGQYGKFLDIETLGANKAPEEEFHELIEYAVLASQRNTFDPMDLAITALARRSEELAEHLHDEWVMIKGYPLSRELLSISQVWKR